MSTLATATAHAQPAPTPSPTAQQVHYTAHNEGGTAIVSIDSGRLVVDHGQFQIQAADGSVLAGIPLEFNVDDIAFPIDAHIDGRTARLIPSLDPERAHARPVALPFQNQAPWKTPYDREAAAFSRMVGTITAAGAAGSITGAVGAGVIGCLLGGATLAVATSPIAMMFGAGPVAGCLIGAAALAPLGAVGGALVVGAPATIAAVIQYFTTINEPFPAK
ncbi:hypothetical protein C8258_06435 [Nocardia sp. MDA0666]|nr:hypothetical protein C8258_06435 [Nocardia sp. MDA0666]